MTAFQRTRTASLACLLAAVLLAACSRDEPQRDSAGASDGTRVDRDPRPSIVLVVIESLRSDAVGSYGPDSASPFPRDGRSPTPRLDALAAEGTRHAWAFADSPDSVASHASLFTGLRVDQHGVGLFARPTAGPELETVAERLRAAGYQTAAFVENPMVGPDFGLDQGFDSFATPQPGQLAANVRAARAVATGFDVVSAARRWYAGRDASRPYFLFVNLADPHLPLGPAVHPEFLPEGVTAARVDDVFSGGALRMRVCRKLPDPESLAILRGLYLSRVAEADAKLGALLDLVRAGGDSPLTIVTTDHGEHFGEGKLLGHHFDVDHRVLHVPLVVAGAETPPRVASTPVALHRVAASISCASGESAACEAGLPAADRTESEPIFSIFADDRALLPPAAAVDTGSLTGATHHGRVHCDPDEPVFGRAVSLIRFPMKLSWRAGGHYRLHDLSWDPGERSDQLERQPEVAARLRRELAAFIADRGLELLRGETRSGSLRERAMETFTAARKAVLASPRTELDAVWFAQLVLRQRPDPELAEWVEGQIALHEDDPFYPIIQPTGRSKARLPDDPGRGLVRWRNYLLASVAEPEPLALRFLGDYLALEASGYVLTHQLTALLWAETVNRPLLGELRARRPRLLAAISAEQAQDPGFSDLWVERAALLSAFGHPDEATLEQWVERIVDNHLGDGDFGDGASEIEFDGQTLPADHLREHVRGLALIVLARYLGD